jgi:3-oxoacyl-[acyl-carrier protein] reductase
MPRYQGDDRSFAVEGRTVIVTGASRGIGYGIAEVFADGGAHVTIVGRDRDVAARAVTRLAEHGASVNYVSADISMPSEFARMAEEVKATRGDIDVWCANVGMFETKKLADMTEGDYNETFDLNMKGCLFSVQACLPAPAASDHGRVVVTSSITGPMTGVTGWTYYGASKAAQLGFVRAAAMELAPQRITVNAILPGTINSDGLMKMDMNLDEVAASIPLQRLGDPRDVGCAALYFASDEAGYITGQTLVVDRGVTLIE